MDSPFRRTEDAEPHRGAAPLTPAVAGVSALAVNLCGIYAGVTAACLLASVLTREYSCC